MSFAVRSVAVALPLAFMLVASPVMAATFVVDDDRKQCSSARYQTIQAAVDVAAPGDTVKVCAGLYEESVVVSKSLKLHGPKKGADARSRKLGGSNEAVVRSTRPFSLAAHKITVDGFSIVVQLDQEGEGAGIHVYGTASGYRIFNNLFEDSTVAGIYLGRVSGTLAYIQRNHFLGHLGILADDNARAANLIISDNLLVNASIHLVGNRHESIHILRNSFRFEPAVPTACLGTRLPCRPRLVLSETRYILVQGNKLVGSAATLERVENVRVVDNMFRNGVGVGIELLGENASTLIAGNRIAGYEVAGIRLDQASGVEVEGNEVEDNPAGIVLRGAEANRLSINNVEDNADYGIDLDASSANIMDRNEARGNGILDCRDASRGAGSVGTANTWTDNTGSRASPSRICVDR